MSPSILIADDDPQVLAALRIFLVPEGYRLTCSRAPEDAVASLTQEDFSVALIDLNYQRDTTSGREGLDLLEKIKALDEDLPVIVMTGFGSVELAVEAMKLGAADFIEKPWDNERLLSILRTQVQLKSNQDRSRKLEAQNALLQQQASSRPQGIVAESMEMRQVLAQIEKLAKSDMNVLLTGENGTGKSMLAEYLHQCSARSEQAFVAVNMGAISENLFESEMFGHVKGAFTDAKTNRIGRFELAQAGSLFLDEIANIPLSQQAKLLRVLEQRQYEKLGSSKTLSADVRIISATNASLAELIQSGEFRQDLLYRLNTVEIHIPSLRARQQDILPMAQAFLRQHAEKYRLPMASFHPDAITALNRYTWPGNIRELSHVVERALFLCQNHEIAAADLNLPVSFEADNGLDFSQASLDDIEKYILIERMQRHDNKPLETAESLGLSRSAYYRRLEKYGL
ncbi:sigma-54 dependent transcriptional regulator [Bowmanella sp. Y26]|uniref:sigma-54-dependent transcriptional regulator n=1 Tax=Bowmanella yangjiangensis TaxID=2811230 RepID=UPI001BDC05A3|nr:sigma-54 dependent transcriptional regulator [Bowmanella yangjiangensis]MBT1062442.1 sigma-54 dependent transcriptional regulator [Bowmanella yangjiangensis]